MCSGELTFMDLDTGESVKLGNTDLTIAGNNSITFTTERLTPNHRYNVTIRAANIAGSATSNITISECIHTSHN